MFFLSLLLFRHLVGALAWGPPLFSQASGTQRGPPGWGPALQFGTLVTERLALDGPASVVQLRMLACGERGYGDGSTPYA